MWLKRVKGAKTETLVLPVVEKKGKTVEFKGHGQGLPTVLDEPFEVPDDVAEYLLAGDDEKDPRFAKPTGKQTSAAKKAATEDDSEV